MLSKKYCDLQHTSSTIVECYNVAGINIMEYYDNYKTMCST